MKPIASLLTLLTFASMTSATALAHKEGEPIYGYLFAHMTHEKYGRLYYALSEDGLHWKRLNGGEQVKGDEYWGHADITVGHDGRYYLMGNHVNEEGEREPHISIWVSDDLLEWELFTHFRPDVSHAMENPGNNYGAPKMYFDPANENYYITWHTSNAPRRPGVGYWRAQRTFYVKSKDLKSFTQAKRLFPWNIATIDVILRREGDRLYAFIKDEREPSSEEPTGKSIRMSWAKSIEGPWADMGPSISPSFREAPTLYPKKDGSGWYMFFEHYTGVGYELSTADRLSGPWYTIWNRNYSVPESSRHGCMIPLNEEEYKRIEAKFGE